MLSSQCLRVPTFCFPLLFVVVSGAIIFVILVESETNVVLARATIWLSFARSLCTSKLWRTFWGYNDLLNCKYIIKFSFVFIILGEVVSQIPEDVHIRHCMLSEVCKGSNATVATTNICNAYPNALDIRRWQRWFSKFKSGNVGLSDAYQSGGPITLDDDVLMAEYNEIRVRQSRHCQTILINLGWPPKNLCSRLGK